jgi:hypothetical protein
MLTLVDNRSGVQVSAAEGSASKTDFGAFGGLSSAAAAAAGLGGYTNTAQGKVISRGLHGRLQPDGHRSLRNYKAQTVQAARVSVAVAAWAWMAPRRRRRPMCTAGEAPAPARRTSK